MNFQSFSTNGQPTIEFKDQSLDFLADSATGLMFYDIKDITDGYDCTSKVSKKTKNNFVDDLKHTNDF